MILKLVSKIVYQADTDNPEVKVETFFYDGFDKTKVFHVSIKEMEPSFGGGDSVDCFTNETTGRVLGIRLFKRGELFKTLYLNYGFGVYLMSDEGKTIERIN